MGDLHDLDSPFSISSKIYWDTISHKRIHDAVVYEWRRLKPVLNVNSSTDDFQQPVFQSESLPTSSTSNSIFTDFLACQNLTLKIPEITATIHCHNNNEDTVLKVDYLTLEKRPKYLQIRVAQALLFCDGHEIVKIRGFSFSPITTAQDQSLLELRRKFCRKYMAMKHNRTWRFQCESAVISFADYEYDFATHLDCLVNMIKWIRHTYVKRPPSAFNTGLVVLFT